MSRRAKVYDKAMAESFVKTLKHEEVLAGDYRTFHDVIHGITHVIDRVYKRKRHHSALGHLSPEQLESRAIPARVQAAFAALR